MAKKVSCQDAGNDCGFEIRSNDKDEVIDFTRQHAERVHDMELSRTQAEDLLQDV